MILKSNKHKVGKSCNLSIATSQNWTDKSSGEKKEKTEWHRIVFVGVSWGDYESIFKKGS